jgi:hypothetical protein
MPNDKRPITATLLYGAVSIVLYTALIMKSDLFVEMAQRTKNGEKWLFLVPIVIAFVFSYVHGTFTGLFWESLGFKAAAKNGSKK